MRLLFLFFLGLELSFSSCTYQTESKDWREFKAWLQDPEHGLVKHKEVNHLKLKIQYLPQEYLGYQELLKNNLAVDKQNLDSLIKEYRNSITFLIQIHSTENVNSAALTNSGINSESEYKQRIHLLSFKMNEFISLHIDGAEYKPLLVNYDGQNELVKEVSFIAVFDGKNLKNKTVVMSFDDPFWQMGTNHFTFENEDIEKIPKLDL